MSNFYIEIGCKLCIVLVLIFVAGMLYILYKRQVESKNICRECKIRELMYLKYIFDECKEKPELRISFDISKDKCAMDIIKEEKDESI